MIIFDRKICVIAGTRTTDLQFLVIFLGLCLQDVSVVGNKCQQWWLHLKEAICTTAHPYCSIRCITFIFCGCACFCMGSCFLFGLKHSFLSLMLAKTHHFTSPVMIKDRNGRSCSGANRWRVSRIAHMATCWSLWFWLRARGTNTSDFLILPIECKCHTMVEWSQFITFASS